MFSALRQNGTVYVLDKSNRPVLKIAKVVSVSSIQYKNNFSQTVDIVVNSDGETLNFNELPANLSIADFPKTNIVVSESKDSMISEIENMIDTSNHILDSVDYHKGVLESCNDMLVRLNPKFAKEKEQEDKISALEEKVSNIENGISDMKSMMSQLLDKNT